MGKIAKIVSDYISAHRRITVVGLGTFISQGEGAGVIFSEFLIDDDGVLRSLLKESGVSELAAVGEIENFVTQVKDSLARGERVEIGDLGQLCVVDGAIVLLKEGYEEELEDESEVFVAPSADHIKGLYVDDIQQEEQESNDLSESIEIFRREEETRREQAPVAEKTRKRSGGGIDLWLVVPFLVGIFAFLVLAHSFVVKWQMGEVELNEPANGIMERMFGDGVDEVDMVDGSEDVEPTK